VHWMELGGYSMQIQIRQSGRRLDGRWDSTKTLLLAARFVQGECFAIYAHQP
jgi:hypothetical protein